MSQLVLVGRISHEDLVAWSNPAGEHRRSTFHRDQVCRGQGEDTAGLGGQPNELSPLGDGAVEEGYHLAVHDVTVTVHRCYSLAQLHLVQTLRGTILRSH